MFWQIGKISNFFQIDLKFDNIKAFIHPKFLFTQKENVVETTREWLEA